MTWNLNWHEILRDTKSYVTCVNQELIKNATMWTSFPYRAWTKNSSEKKDTMWIHVNYLCAPLSASLQFAPGLGPAPPSARRPCAFTKVEHAGVLPAWRYVFQIGACFGKCTFRPSVTKTRVHRTENAVFARREENFYRIAVKRLSEFRRSRYELSNEPSIGRSGVATAENLEDLYTEIGQTLQDAF